MYEYKSALPKNVYSFSLERTSEMKTLDKAAYRVNQGNKTLASRVRI